MARLFIVLIFLFCATPKGVAQDAVSELLFRVEALEREIRATRGRLEEQEFKNRQLEERLKKFQEDSDFRFQELEKKKTSQLPEQKQDKPQVTQSSQGGKTIDSLLKNESADPYEAAYQHYKDKNYGAAESGFDAYLKTSKPTKVADALYWRGLSQMMQKKNREAASSFLEVQQKHSKSSIAPEAMIQLGRALDLMGEKEAACSTYKSFASEHPKAKDSLKEQAKKELARKKCV